MAWMLSRRRSARLSAALVWMVAGCVGAGEKTQRLELPAPRPLAGASQGRFSDEAAAEVRRRVEAVRREAARLGTSHWAGEYYNGDGLGVNQYLYLAPEAGFAFEWHGCLGLYDRNWGEIAESGDLLQLVATQANRQRGFQGIAERFRWVQWGDKSYLLPGGEVSSFCNGINAEGRPRAWLEVRDRDLPDPSIDLLPGDIRKCLLPGPIGGTVREVTLGPTREGIGGWRYRVATAEVELGAGSGVFEGMALYVEGAALSGTVVVATDSTATVELRIPEDTEAPGQLRVGARLVSRPVWGRGDG